MKKDGKIKIIEAAQRLIALHGVEKTSMRDIAEEAGITTGAIYYYYKSKSELLYDVMDYATAVTSELIKMKASPEAKSDEVMDEIARKVTLRLKEHLHWDLRFYLAIEAAQGDETLQTRFANNYTAQIERTAELFNYVFHTQPQPEDQHLAVIMAAAMDGINFQQFIGALPVDIDELTRTFNEFFAYTIPRFQKDLNNLHRFDHLGLD